MVDIQILKLLLSIAPVRNYLEQEVGFISIMINLYHECRSMSESVMLCLGIMVLSGMSFSTRTLIIKSKGEFSLSQRTSL